jgi:hypothetical protein
MIKTLFFLTLILSTLHLKAQSRSSIETTLNVSIGYGMCTTLDQIDQNMEDEIYGTGLYLQCEYNLHLASWVNLIPYGGLIITGVRQDNTYTQKYDYEVTTKALLLGAKVRLVAPIPYFAPYFESGVGMSAGAFVNKTPYRNIHKNGIISHVPITFGVLLGRHQKIDFFFAYYSQPSINQTTGGVGFGINFPIR